MTIDWLTIASPLRIFAEADRLVQAIIIVLLLASIVSWSIIIRRGWTIRVQRLRALTVRHLLSSIGTQQELRAFSEGTDGPLDDILREIEAEWRWSDCRPVRDYDPVRARIFSIAELAIAREGRTLAGAIPMLATIGTSAPFIGLFGTVWGIMGSFIAIGQTHDTSLAIVAPGIAEALLATAAGLFCAIPAVIGYNRLIQGLATVDAEWRAIAGLVEIAISRRFDTRY